MSRMQILWHSLRGTKKDAAFLEAAMQELLSMLRGSPLALPISGERFEGQRAPSVLQHLDNCNLNRCVDSVRTALGSPHRQCGLLIYCDPDDPIACAARRRLKHAAWGISVSGVLSLAYARNNKYLLWHEALHLLEAQDHYDPGDFHRTCESPGCVMQYAADETSVGKGALLCEATQAILHKACGGRDVH